MHRKRKNCVENWNARNERSTGEIGSNYFRRGVLCRHGLTSVYCICPRICSHGISNAEAIQADYGYTNDNCYRADFFTRMALVGIKINKTEETIQVDKIYSGRKTIIGNDAMIGSHCPVCGPPNSGD